MVIRFTAFHQTLASGQFPVRFVDRLNNNYGYPVLNFLYPLPFYLSEIPKIAGFGFVDSIKVIFILSSVSSVVAMFWALAQIFDKRASFTGAILYLFVPYRFVDLYVRGSFGENLAFLFIPLVAGSIFKIAKGKRIFSPVLSFSVAGLILSHNIVAALFLPFFSGFALFVAQKAKFQLFSAFITGVLMAAFFWLPAIHDLKFVKLSQIKVSEVSDHLVSIKQLFIPHWGYGPNPNSSNGLSVQIGIVATFILLTGVFLIISGKIRQKMVIFLTVTALISILLMSNLSLPFWQLFPMVDIIQFPWRLIAIVVFVQSFLAAYLISISAKKKIITVLVSAAALISTITYTRPQSFVDRGDGYYATNEDSTTVRDEYLPLWVKQKPRERANQKLEVKNGEILSSSIKATNYQARVRAFEETQVQVNTIYFPGWQVKIDGKTSSLDYQNQFGLITFQLPKGDHEVIIKYTKSQVHLTSELISLVALIAIGFQFKFLWPKRGS